MYVDVKEAVRTLGVRLSILMKSFTAATGKIKIRKERFNDRKRKSDC